MSFSPLDSQIDSLGATLNLPIDVLRLDLLHPVVSGNKWFKLKEYLQLAESQKKCGLVTFGGAYSNHLVATAAATKANGLQSIGFVRGERTSQLSHTLQEAEAYGMKLYFLTRREYAEKKISESILKLVQQEQFILVPEGGYGKYGMLGAKDILNGIKLTQYTYIIAAVGTGTTLAGLVAAALPTQKVIGILVLKNAPSINSEINALLPPEMQNRFDLIADYHFGGYAKKSSELISFMNRFYRDSGIPTDFVYTAKTFYAVADLRSKGYFSDGEKILVIHTGGLQGNLSVSKGTLIFG